MGRRYVNVEARDRALRRVVALDRLLDWQFRVPGTQWRFGIDPLIGLIPVVGDAVGFALSMYTVIVAWRVGVPFRVVLLMLLNITFDLVVGEVPVAGDLFDVFYKSNRINLRLLAKHLGLPGLTGMPVKQGPAGGDVV